MHLSKTLAATIFAIGFSVTSSHADVIVSELQPTITPGGGWGTFLRGNGTGSIVDLTGAGGNLENSQPLPTSAAQLTTGLSNADGADIGIADNFGNAAAVLPTLSTGYSYYKASTGPGENLAAAPSLKLAIFNPSGTGDSFGQLIYEPYLNPTGGNPTQDVWQPVAIDGTTGQGNDSSGGWWWTGGFGIGSSGAAPPYRSLAEWVLAFQAAGDVDFADAIISGISVGVGTFNQGQNGYFDGVVFNDTTYDFELAATTPVPEPTSLALWGLGALGIACYGRRRRSHAPA